MPRAILLLWWLSTKRQQKECSVAPFGSVSIRLNGQSGVCELHMVRTASRQRRTCATSLDLGPAATGASPAADVSPSPATACDGMCTEGRDFRAAPPNAADGPATKGDFGGSFSIERALEKMVVAGVNVRLTREALQHLDILLRSYGFALRPDSRLAYLWATSKLDLTWTDTEVAHEIMCQQWICASAPYTENLQAFMRAVAEGMKAKYCLRSWNETWRITREYAPVLLKTWLLCERGMCIPNFAPMPVHPCGTCVDAKGAPVADVAAHMSGAYSALGGPA